MRRTAAVIALTLALGTLASAKPHQEALQGKGGNASDTDAWRHYLLARTVSPAPWTVDPDQVINNAAKRFRAEFEKAIDDFNEAQQNRIEAFQIPALKLFIARRDAMVEAYKTELPSWVAQQVEAFKPETRSAGADPATENGCGIPDVITCAITYSRFIVTPGEENADDLDGAIALGVNQILDGAATMIGHPHARHTPTVTVTFDGIPYSVSGKSVCANCYLYVNAVAYSTPKTPGVKGEMSTPEATVVCSDAGKFVDSNPGDERAEISPIEHQ